MIINWMRDRSIVDCEGLVSGLHDLCHYIVDNCGLVEPDLSMMEMYEVGSFAGESAEIFSKYFDAVHCVDPWTSDPNICGLTPACPFNCEDVQRSFDERAAKCGNLVKHVGYSIDVAKTVEDGSLDFVYIDGLHDYGSVKRDIGAWWPKVKVGGFIGGHDYHDVVMNSDFQVKMAVQEFMSGTPSAVDLRLFADTSWVVRKT